MAVVVNPADWKHLNVVQVDSDAARNIDAIREIDDWAAENGFARVNVYHLRPVRRPDGRRVLRGECYRLTAEEQFSAETACQSSAEILANMPVTPHCAGSDR